MRWGWRKGGARIVCRATGRTTVFGVPDNVNHVRFEFWYSNRPMYKSIWVWYAPSVSHGKAFIPSQHDPMRAMAILHTKDGHLIRLSTSCS